MIKGIFQQSFLQSSLVNPIVISCKTVKFLKVFFPFPYNFPVNINIQKVKNNSNTIYLAYPPLQSVSYHFQWCVGCLSSSQLMKPTPLPRCCYCETLGCYAKREQIHLLASYEHPSKKREIIVYHLTNLSKRNCIYLFGIHTNIYLHFNFKRSLP